VLEYEVRHGTSTMINNVVRLRVFIISIHSEKHDDKYVNFVYSKQYLTKLFVFYYLLPTA